MLPAGAVAGWDLHPLESAALSRRTPDADTLTATQKKQNTRRSLIGSVNKIYGAGMVVYAGFIVGFDSEKKSVANEMIDCIEAMSILLPSPG